MNPPTKLRAWDTINETMIYSSEEGAVFTLKNGEWNVKYIRERNFPASEDGPERDEPVWEESEEVEVMMFTGMVDLHGKAMYEGDVIHVRNWGQSDEILLTTVIEWDVDEKGWGFKDFFDVDRYDQFRRIEVIGNIHQNENLLKK